MILATHHPAFSYSPAASKGSGGNHGSQHRHACSQIDQICSDAGVYPHAFLAGHAHNYQRYTRIMQFGGKEITSPSSCAATAAITSTRWSVRTAGEPASEPGTGSDVTYLDGGAQKMKVKHLILAKYDDENYGYLRIYVDKDYLKIGFHQVGTRSLAQSRYDMVTVRLEDRHMVAN